MCVPTSYTLSFGHLDIRPNGNLLSKKPPFMRVWVQSPDLQNIHVYEFRLEFLSYLKKKKKKKNTLSFDL